MARMSGRGVIWSFTIIPSRDYAPEGFEDQAPYAVGIVKLEEGMLVTAMLTDVDLKNIRIGMEVEMVIRKKRDTGDRGLLLYGYSFRPLLPQSNKTLAETIQEIEEG